MNEAATPENITALTEPRLVPSSVTTSPTSPLDGEKDSTSGWPSVEIITVTVAEAVPPWPSPIEY